jgi:hypothetical protein
MRGDGPKDLAALGDLQSKGVLDACLSKRTTWRKDTCTHFCQMHLAVPIQSDFIARADEPGILTRNSHDPCRKY